MNRPVKRSPFSLRGLGLGLGILLVLWLPGVSALLAQEFDLVIRGGRVMDPETGAHGPNESMHLGVFKKAILANVVLLDELSRVPGLVGA